LAEINLSLADRHRNGIRGSYWIKHKSGSRRGSRSTAATKPERVATRIQQTGIYCIEGKRWRDLTNPWWVTRYAHRYNSSIRWRN